MDDLTCSVLSQGLLNKKPSERLTWPHLLEHPFVRETSGERLKREAALADATRVAQESRSWKGEGGAIAGKFGISLPAYFALLCT